MIKVSVLLTCYNIVNYIDTSIQSVFSQDIPYEWELLIGDDGSSDGTYEKVINWQSRYPQVIKVFQMTRNNETEKTGSRAARNRANLLENAVGEYLIFLDGDDCYTDVNKINDQIKVLDNPKYSHCACCAHNISQHYINTGENKDLLNRRIGNRVISANQYWENYYFHPNTIIFRNCCKGIMLNSLYRDYLNDNFITYLILQYGDLFYIDKVMALYNITGDGLWTGKNRTYGIFRNLILFDMELRVNPSMKKSSFIRHLSDFNHVFKYYLKNTKSVVAPLFDNIDHSIVPISYLLFKKGDNLTLSEKYSLLSLRVYTLLCLRFRQLRNLFVK